MADRSLNKETGASCRVSRNVPCTAMASDSKAVRCMLLGPRAFGRKRQSPDCRRRCQSSACRLRRREPEAGRPPRLCMFVSGPKEPHQVLHPKTDLVKSHMPRLRSESAESQNRKLKSCGAAPQQGAARTPRLSRCSWAETGDWTSQPTSPGKWKSQQ